MSVRISRRAAVGGAAGLALLSACGAPPARPTPTSPSKQEGWTPILPNSDLAVGKGRFLFAALDERNRPILDAQVRLRFFDRIDAPTEPKAEVDATFRGQGLGAKGLYVARAEWPPVGAAAVPTRQPLARDVADPKQVCTAVPPCQLHDLTVADALALKRPALL